MGFLDHSTNNIILDAVLTDVGRKKLSQNDGSFSIHKFALGDDEVNYGIIQKYGRTVGKEKIEKNTPILEAMTNESYAQKYKLLSVSNPNLIYLPRLDITTTNMSVIQLSRSKTLTQSLTFELKMATAVSAGIDVELKDQIFIVELPDLFTEIPDASPDNISSQRRATYILPATTSSSKSANPTLAMTIKLRSLSDSMFSVYGNNSEITTYMKVTGVQSGASKEVKIVISKN